VGAVVHSFFLPKEQRAMISRPSQSAISNTSAESSQANLHVFQSKLPSLWLAGTTFSECLFAVATGIHPAALTIGADMEYFLFMDMCAEKLWVSYNMMAQKWVVAAAEYNACWKFISTRVSELILRNTV
jgi:hypothetical protein